MNSCEVQANADFIALTMWNLWIPDAKTNDLNIPGWNRFRGSAPGILQRIRTFRMNWDLYFAGLDLAERFPFLLANPPRLISLAAVTPFPVTAREKRASRSPKKKIPIACYCLEEWTAPFSRDKSHVTISRGLNAGLQVKPCGLVQLDLFDRTNMAMRFDDCPDPYNARTGAFTVVFSKDPRPEDERERKRMLHRLRRVSAGVFDGCFQKTPGAVL